MVAAIKVVDKDADDVIIISSDGIIIRIAANEIRECARPAKGVKVMRIARESKVVTLARAPHDEEETDKLEVDASENPEEGSEE